MGLVASRWTHTEHLRDLGKMAINSSYGPGIPGEAWLQRLREGGRLTGSVPLLEATQQFASRIGAPRDTPGHGWRDRQNREASPPAASGRPSLISAISSLRPGQSESPNPLAPGGYSGIPSAEGYRQLPDPRIPRDRTDVSDTGGGIGGYLRRPGVGNAMIGAGGAMMEAAGQSGATFGGSLGTGLKNFAAERAKYAESEMARSATSQTASAGVANRVSTVVALLDQAGVTDPLRRSQALELAQTAEGLRVVVDQLETQAEDAATSVSQSTSVVALLDLMDIADEATRARFLALDGALAQEILGDQYAAQQGGGGAGGVAIGNWEYYRSLLAAAEGDPVLVAEAEEFLQSTQGQGGRPASPIQIENRVAELGDSGWKIGDPYNPGQAAFLSIARNIPGVYGGQLMSDSQMRADDRIMTEATDWDSVGRFQFATKLEKFDQILEALDGSNRISGPLVGQLLEAGFVPEGLKAAFLGGSINTRDAVNSIVFESLRDTLGPQFTENEGKRLVAAAFNVYLPEEMNRVRIERLRAEIMKTAEHKNGLLAHYNEHGTFINSEDPYLLGENESAMMGHLLIEASDYAGLDMAQLARSVASDVDNLTNEEAMALYVDLASEVESAAVLELRAQLERKVN